MARFIRKEKREIGLPRDALVFRGLKMMDHIGKRVIRYRPGSVEEFNFSDISELEQFSGSAPENPGAIRWINIDGIHDAEEMRRIGSLFSLDPVVLSSIMNVQQRASVQEIGDALVISLKMIRFGNGEHEQIISEHLSLIIRDSLVISFQELEGDVFDPLRDRIRRQRRIVASGADFLALSMIDVVIDNYLLVLSQMGDRIEDLEDDLADRTDRGLIERIYDLKKELNYLRKNIAPTREMIQILQKFDSDLISEENGLFVRDLMNNSTHAVESAESYREVLTDQLSLYHNQISTNLNDIMKILTIFSAFFIPLTFIAGIYGMNFAYMPELSFRGGYFVILGVMAVVAVVMILFFKKRNWFR